MMTGGEIHVTHPDRVLYPERGLTKGDLARYYARVAGHMLPHLVQRPLMLVRCPEGADHDCFYQKHPSPGLPRPIQHVLVEEKRGPKEQLMIADVEGLLALIQMGTLEIHTWGCRSQHLECPDQLVFDIDPDVELDWARVVEAAHRIQVGLGVMGVTGFVKTTGGKGLHVVVPIEPVTPWEDAKRFSRAIVDTLVRAEPDKYLATPSKAQRAGKVFLDDLRNVRGATSIAPFSTRARPGAPVSTPLAWEELTPALRPESFTLESVPARLDTLGKDPWHGFETARAQLPLKLGASAEKSQRKGEG
jgi:bifunctional non-homologous end joining protein LigD